MKIQLYRAQRRRLERLAVKERNAEVFQRYRIVLALGKKMNPTEIHEALGCARSTVYRVAERFLEDGEHGLRNRRAEVPPVKVTEGYVTKLEEMVYVSPRDYGWQRSTWTRELLARQLEVDTGIKLHPTHIGRLLRASGIRWGRPRPGPFRYTTKSAKTRKVNKVIKAIENLPRDEVAVYADEVDIHLNPMPVT